MLLFLNAIPRRDLEASAIVEMLNRTQPYDVLRARYAFQHKIVASDDSSTMEVKTFLLALWYAWTLNVRTLLDV
jgi:hypothetical protein